MNDQLHADARTTWAVHKYQQVRHFTPITEQVAGYLLNWLGPEHAEVITRGVHGRRPVKWERAKSTGLVVRTLTRSLLLYDDLTNFQWPSGRDDHIQPKENYRWGHVAGSLGYSVDGAPKVQVFAPTDTIAECLRHGAGEHILRLPERPDVPPIPVLGEAGGGSAQPSRRRIPTGWASLEQLAEEHLRSIGVHDARRSGAGADGGLDVVSAQVVAQVKYTAKPVGRPVLQGLVGAADPGQNTACYSTAGYTAEALEYADDRYVALYKITELGEVAQINLPARHLELLFGPDADAWQVADAYAGAAVQRAGTAFVSLSDSEKPRISRLGRANSYARGANQMLRAKKSVFDTPRDMALHGHHIELLMATWATHAYGHYPNDAVMPHFPENPYSALDEPGLSDFY